MYDECAKKAWGPEHKSTLDTRHNLSSLHKQKSKLEDPVNHCQQVVRGSTKLLDPEHPDTVDAVNELESCKVEMSKGKTDANVTGD